MNSILQPLKAATTPGENELPLTAAKDFNPGDEGMILGFAAGDRTYKKRLLSLGLTKGTRIQVIRRAPLGDPIEIRVRGYHMSLRKQEAEILRLARI